MKEKKREKIKLKQANEDRAVTQLKPSFVWITKDCIPSFKSLSNLKLSLGYRFRAYGPKYWIYDKELMACLRLY